MSDLSNDLFFNFIPRVPSNIYKFLRKLLISPQKILDSGFYFTIDELTSIEMNAEEPDTPDDQEEIITFKDLVSTNNFVL